MHDETPPREALSAVASAMVEASPAEERGQAVRTTEKDPLPESGAGL